MPNTPLTKILHEFRAYRPRPHREFLAYVAARSEQIGVQDFSIADQETAILYLKTLNHVRSFRWRHWLFAREYIIRRTPHPTATGGSPIVTVCVPHNIFRSLVNFVYGVYLFMYFFFFFVYPFLPSPLFLLPSVTTPRNPTNRYI